MILGLVLFFSCNSKSKVEVEKDPETDVEENVIVDLRDINRDSLLVVEKTAQTTKLFCSLVKSYQRINGEGNQYAKIKVEQLVEKAIPVAETKEDFYLLKFILEFIGEFPDYYYREVAEREGVVINDLFQKKQYQLIVSTFGGTRRAYWSNQTSTVVDSVCTMMVKKFFNNFDVLLKIYKTTGGTFGADNIRRIINQKRRQCIANPDSLNLWKGYIGMLKITQKVVSGGTYFGSDLVKYLEEAEVVIQVL